LSAYWKVVGEITRLEVKGALFSTSLGRLLLYEPEELTAEWERLEKLAPPQLEARIHPDSSDNVIESFR
jgi:hypothetical protein